MQAVFNAPVASHRVGKRFHRGETEQKVAGFPADLLINAPFGSNHPNPSQAFPPLLRVEIGQDLRITDGPVVPDLEPTVPFLNAAIRLTLAASKGLFFSHRKG